MLFPQDCPTWVERVFSDIKDRAEGMMLKAKSSDEAMKAAGAYSLWKAVEDELDMERKRQDIAIRARNERLNARDTN